MGTQKAGKDNWRRKNKTVVALDDFEAAVFMLNITMPLSYQLISYFGIRQFRRMERRYYLAVSSRETTNFDRLLKKQEDPLTKKGIVGAVCRTFGIHEALQHHTNDAYKRETKDRYTFVGGSTSKGVIVYDERFAFSESRH